MAQKNFKVNNGLTTPLITLLDVNGNTVNVSTTTNTANYDLHLPVNDGDSGQVLTTDGSGNLSWSSPAGTPTSIVNGNSNVNIPDANGNVNISAIGNAANGDCDFTTYAQLNTGLTTGDVTVALTDSNANITLQVTPASTNSTVWTTQFRVI